MMCLTDEVTQLASQTASLLILIAAGLFEYMLGVNSEFIPTEHWVDHECASQEQSAHKNNLQ